MKELNPILREFTVEAREAENGQITVIASTPAVDRMGDIVEAPWDLSRFKSNPVIQWAHNYELPPIGRATSIGVEDGILMATIEFDESEENPLGRTVASQMRRGFLNAVSVGFQPRDSIKRSALDVDDLRYADRGMVFRNSELLELSVVAIPANPQAVALRSAIKAMDPRSPRERAVDALSDRETRNEIEAILLSEPSTENKSSPRPMVNEIADAMSDLFGPDPLSSVFGHSGRDDSQP